MAALHPSRCHTLASLSQSLMGALQHLVKLAGGWATRAPQCRQAYDSNVTRMLRPRLEALLSLESLLRAAPLSSGCWPRHWLLLLDRLEVLGVFLPRSSQSSLLAACHSEAGRIQCQLGLAVQAMRRVRAVRWREQLPALWQDRPGVVYNWLRAEGSPKGATPILDAAGCQCTTPAAVDLAVRGYWGDTVLRQHAGLDEESRWAAFLASRFGPCIPTGDWPHRHWDGPQVKAVLRQMREAAAPGSPGIPIAVWRGLPDSWMAAVARLLNLVEETGCWPTEWLDAYVAMIPTSSGGTRPRDQRPITVLSVLYRLWSKGIVMEWTPVLQGQVLGPSAMGFRAGASTLHVAQVLSDLISVRRRQVRPLWLASFDIEKCFDSLPWWGLFRGLRHAGVPLRVVEGFSVFYRDLRRHFRYGQVDGAVWHAANGMAQGCPASPDLLNLLFEAFHRWASASGHGVYVAGCSVASVSFAEDLALVGASKEGVRLLIEAYLEFCALLGIRDTKIQLWSNSGAGQTLRVGDLDMETADTFRIVGVVLGASESVATCTHAAPRVEKALATSRRLQHLELPASLVSLLWRTTVLPQAVYGCEVRDIRASNLRSTDQGDLCTAGRASLGSKRPFELNSWRSPSMLAGLPLGDSSLRDPMLEILERRLCWLHHLANSPGLAGTVHRAIAWRLPGQWVEPTAALRTALCCLRWTVRRTSCCLRSQHWPRVDPEPCFSGPVVLLPEDSFPQPEAVFTDGSLSSSGGAAAVQPDTDVQVLASVPMPRSSPHCELVALCLATRLAPRHILTDSLSSLHLIHGWGARPTACTLGCADRVEVRQFICSAMALEVTPVLVPACPELFADGQCLYPFHLSQRAS